LERWSLFLRNGEALWGDKDYFDGSITISKLISARGQAFFLKPSHFLHTFPLFASRLCAQQTIAKMDLRAANIDAAKLEDMHVEKVRANDRKAAAFEIDPVAEKKLLRKLDLRVVPVLWWLYMLVRE
jgi:hypothetical protein